MYNVIIQIGSLSLSFCDPLFMFFMRLIPYVLTIKNIVLSYFCHLSIFYLVSHIYFISLLCFNVESFSYLDCIINHNDLICKSETSHKFSY